MNPPRKSSQDKDPQIVLEPQAVASSSAAKKEPPTCGRTWMSCTQTNLTAVTDQEGRCVELRPAPSQQKGLRGVHLWTGAGGRGSGVSVSGQELLSGHYIFGRAFTWSCVHPYMQISAK